MDGGEEGGGIRLSKRFDKDGEVDYKTKSGTAWSHSYLNQKPWHPLSYPNQRRKWIAEQTHAQRDRRAEEVAREYAQEQEFFRQTALISKKEKEKVEMMKAVSFMYVRPPGYNAESAKAAEVLDGGRKEELNNPSQDLPDDVTTRISPESREEKKKPRPKDVFGRALPTAEEFEILKDAPRLETGVAGRAKPFGVELRNVRCLRCGNYGHQSGDRECPLKDAIMPNEESRLKRDDPLNAILAHTDPSEPLKWELKQKPGISPPRGGFKLDDPNQQILAEDIFDEYGGFLSGGDNLPELLTNFTSSHPKKKKSSKKTKHKNLSRPRKDAGEESSPSDEERGSNKDKEHKEKKRKKQNYPECSLYDKAEVDRNSRSRDRWKPMGSDDDCYDKVHPRSRRRQKHDNSSFSVEIVGHRRSEKTRGKYRTSSPFDDYDKSIGSRQRERSGGKHRYSHSDEDSDHSGDHQRSPKGGGKHHYTSSWGNSNDSGYYQEDQKSRYKHPYSHISEDSDDSHGRRRRGDKYCGSHTSKDRHYLHSSNRRSEKNIYNRF